MSGELTNQTCHTKFPQNKLLMPASVLFLFVLCLVIKALFTEHDEPIVCGLPPKFDDHKNKAGNHNSDTESHTFLSLTFGQKMLSLTSESRDSEINDEVNIW